MPGRLAELVQPQRGLACPYQPAETGHVDMLRLEPQPVAHPDGRLLGDQQTLPQDIVGRPGGPAHRIPRMGDVTAQGVRGAGRRDLPEAARQPGCRQRIAVGAHQRGD